MPEIGTFESGNALVWLGCCKESATCSTILLPVLNFVKIDLFWIENIIIYQKKSGKQKKCVAKEQETVWDALRF